ncbi:MAG: hypothetical protein R3F14_40100 [Polyangiaceae bacterium]
MREEDWGQKMERYRASGIGEVVRFDPDNTEHPIRVWDHVDGDLVEREPAEDRVAECACLGLFWVAVPHPTLRQMLRLARDRAGKDLLPTPAEAAEEARDALAAELAELKKKLAEQGITAPGRTAGRREASGAVSARKKGASRGQKAPKPKR